MQSHGNVKREATRQRGENEEDMVTEATVRMGGHGKEKRVVLESRSRQTMKRSRVLRTASPIVKTPTLLILRLLELF